MQVWKLALLTVVASSSLMAATTEQAWRDWQRLSDAKCRSHHVEWICGDCYLFLVEDFDATLDKANQQKVERIADIQRQCASEIAGFGCETGRSFLAYKELGLMAMFVDYGCRMTKCEEVAICSRLPPQD